MNLLTQLLKTGKSVKMFRGALLEASRNFAPGSLADLVFKFYVELHKYYENLLVYQFQLYSDLPPYILGVTKIAVKVKNDVKVFTFSKGKGKNFACLQDLNDLPFDYVSEITYYFELSPELTNLITGTINNTNKSLFYKIKELSVAKGDGTYITGNFTPEWDEKGVTLTCAGVSHGAVTADKMFNVVGGV